MAVSADHPRSRPWVAAIARQFDRVGVVGAVALVTSASAAATVTSTWWWLLDYPPELMTRSLIVGALVATVVSVPVNYVLCRLLADLSRSRAALHDLAHLDSLTRASSRRHLMEAGPRLLAAARAGEHHGRLTLILLDIDYFKAINDRFGHEGGDLALQAVSTACRQTLLAGALFARFGGEEFVVMLPGADLATGAEVAERLRQRIAALRIDGPDQRAIRATVSLGVAVARTGSLALPTRADTLESLTARADKALYAAKAGGRDRVCTEALTDGPAQAGSVSVTAGGAAREGAPGDRAARDAAGAEAVAAAALGLEDEVLEAVASRGGDRRLHPAASVSTSGPIPSASALETARWAHSFEAFTLRRGRLASTLVLVVLCTGMAVASVVPLMLPFRLDAYALGMEMCATITPGISFTVSWVLSNLVSELGYARRFLREIADFDNLTRAHSRPYFMDKAQPLLAGRGASVVVLMDLDNFKGINDGHGHAVGDQVLMAVSDACRASLREGDLFARFGGEEFAAVLPGADSQEGSKIVERMRQAIAALRLTTPAGEAVPVTASFGLVEYGRLDTGAGGSEASRLQSALSAADRALYQAKRSGKNRIVTWPLAESLAPV